MDPATLIVNLSGPQCFLMYNEMLRCVSIKLFPENVNRQMNSPWCFKKTDVFTNCLTKIYTIVQCAHYLFSMPFVICLLMFHIKKRIIHVWEFRTFHSLFLWDDYGTTLSYFFKLTPSCKLNENVIENCMAYINITWEISQGEEHSCFIFLPSSGVCIID